MAISFINKGGATATNGGDPSVDMSTWGLVQNDLVIAAGFIPEVDIDCAMNTTGYTEVADLFADDTSDTNLGVFYKFMGASPDSTSVFEGLGDPSTGIGLAVMAFRGVKLVADGGPFDTTAVTATGIDTANANPPSINHSGGAGIWTVIAAATGGPGTATWTGVTNYTTNEVIQPSGVDTSRGIVALGYNTSPSDPEDPGTYTISTDSAGFSWCAVTMALSPAAAGSKFIPIIVGA